MDSDSDSDPDPDPDIQLLLYPFLGSIPGSGSESVSRNISHKNYLYLEAVPNAVAIACNNP